MDLLLLLLVLLLRQEVAALKHFNITVPTYTFKGESAALECRYDLESDKLSSISWYKDNEEFYRYAPKKQPVKQTYPVNGIRVDDRQSDDHRVLLQRVELHTSGLYRCEVSGEAPNFESVQAEASMEVIALPQEDPTITVEEKIYANGDILTLNCTSGKSHPPAHLKWFINGVQVPPDAEIIIDQHGLYAKISSLSLEIGADHLSNDRINVRCQSSLHSSHQTGAKPVDVRNTEVYVRGDASVARPSLYLLAAVLLQHFFQAV